MNLDTIVSGRLSVNNETASSHRSNHESKNPSNFFLDCLFGNYFCLSKMDFIIMLQSPACSWIFDEEQIREHVERYFLESSRQHRHNHSCSPNSCDCHHSDEDVHAKMVESQDELQFCQFEENGDSDGHIHLD